MTNTLRLFIIFLSSVLLHDALSIEPTNSDFFTSSGLQASPEQEYYEVTASDYCNFLNAVATTDPLHLYDAAISSDSLVASIIRIGDPGSYLYQVIAGRESFPISYLNWLDKVRYCNWRENNQPTRETADSTTEEASYLLDGMDNDSPEEAIRKNKEATYFIADDENVDSSFDDLLKSNQGKFYITSAESSNSLIHIPPKKPSEFWNTTNENIAGLAFLLCTAVIARKTLHEDTLSDSPCDEEISFIKVAANNLDSSSLIVEKREFQQPEDNISDLSNSGLRVPNRPPFSPIVPDSLDDPDGSLDGIRVTPLPSKNQKPGKSSLKSSDSNWAIDESTPKDQSGRISSVMKNVSFQTHPIAKIAITERYLLRKVTKSKLETRLHITQSATDKEENPIIKELMTRYLTGQKNSIECDDKAYQAEQEDLADAWKEAKNAASREASFALESIARRTGLEAGKLGSTEPIVLYRANPNLSTPSTTSADFMICSRKAAEALVANEQTLSTYWADAAKSLERTLDLRDAATAAKKNPLRANTLNTQANVTSVIASSKIKAAKAFEKRDYNLAKKYSTFARSSRAKKLTLSSLFTSKTIESNNPPLIQAWTTITKVYQEAYKQREAIITATDDKKTILTEKVNHLESQVSLLEKAAQALENDNTALANAFTKAAEMSKQVDQLKSNLLTAEPGLTTIFLKTEIERTEKRASLLEKAAQELEKGNQSNASFLSSEAHKLSHFPPPHRRGIG